jgi:hypothetical protein
MEQISGVAGGMPYLASPRGCAPRAPLVVAWHLHDPPRSETAMAAALPLSELPACRVYLGLPLSGSRLPEGGLEAYFQLGYPVRGAQGVRADLPLLRWHWSARRSSWRAWSPPTSGGSGSATGGPRSRARPPSGWTSSPAPGGCQP